uniref:Uncharacterized protein n=1 Tax=Rhizophora mucronata TaxID=61149 RepID=A0A2P2IIQ5_RHIMU
MDAQYILPTFFHSFHNAFIWNYVTPFTSQAKNLAFLPLLVDV